MVKVTPGGVLVEFVFEENLKRGNGNGVMVIVVEKGVLVIYNFGSFWSFKRLDLDGRSWRSDEGNSGRNWAVMEFGFEDRMGILKFVEGILEKLEIWRGGGGGG